MNYRSFSDLSSLIENNIQNIPWDIDLVVGVPRSGLLVANMIALLMNKTLTDLNGYLDNRLIASGKTKNVSPKLPKDCKKVLIVEDSVDSGASIISCKEKMSSIKDVEFIYLAAYVEPGKEKMVDIFFEILPHPRVFEWNLFHHKGVISNSCFDIDGVLCIDPTNEQNDDGDKYIDFIKNAEVKMLPTVKIDKIVTSRLEKYRSYTEEWLKKNNIEYNELVMLNATAEERREKNLHASFKAEVYKNSKDELFIESEINQAIDINKISGKPVYCTENNYMYDGSKEYLKMESRKRGFKAFLLKFRLVRYLNKKRKNRKNGTK
jgi:uncharacterized HAD superfamily protein/hypoxanthine phosphoribosyltransferase